MLGSTVAMLPGTGPYTAHQASAIARLAADLVKCEHINSSSGLLQSCHCYDYDWAMEFF